MSARVLWPLTIPQAGRPEPPSACREVPFALLFGGFVTAMTHRCHRRCRDAGHGEWPCCPDGVLQGASDWTTVRAC
jgi:hypothetical protein